MKAILALAALLATVPAWAAVEIKVNAQEGDKLVGEKAFRVTVTAKNPVTSVEFYVGDDLRDSDTSTPYEFRFDSLMETDGPLTLKFKAYTAEGESGEKVVKLTVDNGVAKGAPFHVEQALLALQDSKWDDAITSGRIAQKADPNFNPARLVLARANLGKGVLDTAQKFAEDALAADANSMEAADLLSAINLRRAFNTVSRSSDRTETLNIISTAFKTAAQNRRKVLDAAVDRLGAVTPENRIAVADAAIRAGRYPLAITALTPAFAVNRKDAAVANRLAYAQLRAGRPGEAFQTMTAFQKEGTLDGYGYALLAVLQIDRGDDAAADNAMREALLSDSENLGVLTSQAYIALRRNRAATLANLSNNLARDNGQRPEVNYFISALANRRNAFTESREAFRRGILAEPAFADLFIEQANTSIGLALTGTVQASEREFQFNSARAYYEAALEARPSSDPLVGLVIVSLLQNKPEEAARLAQAAVQGAPNSAMAQYAFAGAYSAWATVVARTNRTAADTLRAQALQALQKAGQLDRRALEGRSTPNGQALWTYFSGAGRPVVISAPGR